MVLYGLAAKAKLVHVIFARSLNGDEPPPEPRRFVFDRPFLIYLLERQAKQPYFVMWVENPEVLVPDADRNINAASTGNGNASQ